jgi:uncharacterized small protein (DUF1192 family)
MKDLKRFFSADVIVISLLCLLALVVFIAGGDYLSAAWVLATITYVIIARGYETQAEDSDAAVTIMAQKISELEEEIAKLQKENGYLDTVKSSLEWHRATEKTNSTRTIAELKEDIERLTAELEKAKAGNVQETKKKPGRKKKLELTDKDVARIKTEMRTAGLTPEEE